ncbi:hypothetical protein AAU61_10490 [Desulfocarbo indianensis]|nr:hypothetical protein AAU61_10490 [Desulfocarbo indianensis]
METAISASTFSIVSFIATIASLLLAVVAIWLSLYFYKQSNELAEKTKEAARDIQSGVVRLEKLFDKLYEGTFSMMKDTVSDMRRHMWPEDVADDAEAQEELEKKAEEKIEAFRQEMAKEVASLADRQKKADGKLDATKEELQQLVEKAINGSLEVEREVREENIRDAILQAVMEQTSMRGYVDVANLFNTLENRFPFNSLIDAIDTMAKEGDLMILGKANRPFKAHTVGPSDQIMISDRGRRALSRRLAQPES